MRMGSIQAAPSPPCDLLSAFKPEFNKTFFMKGVSLVK